MVRNHVLNVCIVTPDTRRAKKIVYHVSDVNISRGNNMTEKLTEVEIEKKVNEIYDAFGSSTGVLFGIPHGHRSGVTAVIKAFLRSEGRW